MNKTLENKIICLEGYFIAHRIHNTKTETNNNYKYFCYDARNCQFKKVNDNINYCQLHISNNKYIPKINDKILQTVHTENYLSEK